MAAKYMMLKCATHSHCNICDGTLKTARQTIYILIADTQAPFATYLPISLYRQGVMNSNGLWIMQMCWQVLTADIIEERIHLLGIGYYLM